MFRINDNIGVNSSNSEFIILSAYCKKKETKLEMEMEMETELQTEPCTIRGAHSKSMRMMNCLLLHLLSPLHLLA